MNYKYSQLTFSVQVYSQILEDVHVRWVGNGAHGRCAAFVVDVRNSLSTYVEHQCINQLDVVAVARFIWYLIGKIQKALTFYVPSVTHGTACTTTAPRLSWLYRRQHSQMPTNSIWHFPFCNTAVIHSKAPKCWQTWHRIFALPTWKKKIRGKAIWIH